MIDFLGILGVGAVLAGVWWIYPPIAVILFGFFLIFLGVRLALTPRDSQNVVNRKTGRTSR